jgi:excisionase family DNA binding protein
MMDVLDPVTPQDNERPGLQILNGVINSFQEKGIPKLVGSGGFEIELPESVFRALCQITYHMLKGRTVSIIPVNRELTSQEAADFLNVSRPFLIKLLEQNEIPYIKVGSHRRIRFSDILKYQNHQDEVRRQELINITHLAEDEDIYD